MSDRTFLVTGSYGCIGAWAVHELVEDGEDVVTFDLSSDPRRLALLLDADRLARIPHVAGDISDLDTVERALDAYGITNVIHLAALQVPFCRADPPLGARVNVLGTVNVFEAVRRRLDRMAPLVFASSIAAFDVPEGEAPPAMSAHPGTIYGVFKRANESTAFVYGAENGVPSVGLRPHTVYGIGRDQGLTSAPTTAMLAAAAGVPFTIPYGGASQLQLARDVARAFIGASVSSTTGATMHTLPGPTVSIPEVIEAIRDTVPESEGSIDFEDVRLPFPAEADSSSFGEIVPGFVSTPLEEGVRSSIERFRALLADGLVPVPVPI
jgi:nucleoside-diphosphate-sugar epimerase